MKDELRISLSPRLSAVHGVAQMIEELGHANDLPEQKIFMVNLAVEELITNTVSYGLKGVVRPRIEITVQVHNSVLALTMVDNGQRFDPTHVESPDITAPVEERSIGGLGIYLVTESADRVRYEYADGENRLTMEHDLTPVSA